MFSRSNATLGERVAALRRDLGLSQRDLATEIGRSESWVSQVERDVLPVERVSVLQALADALGASVRDLRPDAVLGPPSEVGAAVDELASLRLAMTGHPALGTLLSTTAAGEPASPVALQERVNDAWRLTHASEFKALSAILVPLLRELEHGARTGSAKRRADLASLLTRSYQAASAAFSRQDEADAAWLAADRAIRWAELAGDPLGAVAGGFRMGHAFLTLRRLDQAEQVATNAISALEPLAERDDCSPEALSLYGAMHLLLAVVSAREGNRAATRKAITKARAIAARIGHNRNDYNTEFGPTNVELHAVSTAIDLGDAGEAIALAQAIDATDMSPERQSRLLVDVARAHVQRRHIGDAVAALLDAERLAPEQVQTHSLVRDTVRDLLTLTGRRTTTDLSALSRRIGLHP